MPTTSTFNQIEANRPRLERLGRFRACLLGFLFPETPDLWLATLRIGLGIQITLFCLSMRHEWTRLFARTGSVLINRDLIETLLNAQAPFVPRFGWLVSIGDNLGLSEETVLHAAWIALLIAGCCLLVGLCSRVFAIIAWFIQLCAVSSSGLLSYGMDNFTIIGLFYLMLAPFPDRYCLDRYIWKSPMKDLHLHGFFRRVLQLHLCISYFFAGLTKCLGSGWWNGDNMWLALTRPPFNVLPVELIMSWQWVLPFAGIAVCLLETSYPFLIWPKRTRLVCLTAVIGMHIGIAVTMGMYLFGLIMIILNTAAFGPGTLFPERATAELPQGDLERVEASNS